MLPVWFHYSTCLYFLVPSSVNFVACKNGWRWGLRRRVEAVNSKGCTRLFGDISFSSSFRSMRSFESMSSPASTSSVLSETLVAVEAKSTGPFSGLVICVTGLSKVRLSESLYSVEGIGENVVMQGHARQSHMAMPFPEKESNRSLGSTFSGLSFYIDTDISPELQHKVVEAAAVEGAEFVDEWFVGCDVSHVVCEGPSVQKYIGHSCNLVSPVWVIKTAREKRMHRLVHMSADMAREVGIILEDSQHGIYGEGINGDNGSQAAPSSRINASQEERQKIVNLAKNGVRKRRGRRMQTCKIPIRPITPISLLDSICWSISEPTSTASVYTDSFIVEDASEHHAPICFDAKGDGKESESAFVNFSRPLMESEKTELIFRNQFLTILFPVDRFAEIGPCSRTFVSDTGFTCLQVLDHIHAFYQVCGDVFLCPLIWTCD
ncbi:hypothetical protein RHSIM_Rhsim06G0092200 [Rhododendron simsii]|uniref:BRCT domain-containing protein n=1 Tax=Rhododendron simsii TaxID=118357 RepID=A0A834GSC6_RHOSS|nr:hypothetical protein RHSIM_Rhsim06G0092200 [Rhododendron simsii]